MEKHQYQCPENKDQQEDIYLVGILRAVLWERVNWGLEPKFPKRRGSVSDSQPVGDTTIENPADVVPIAELDAGTKAPGLERRKQQEEAGDGNGGEHREEPINVFGPARISLGGGGGVGGEKMTGPPAPKSKNKSQENACKQVYLAGCARADAKSIGRQEESLTCSTAGTRVSQRVGTAGSTMFRTQWTMGKP